LAYRLKVAGCPTGTDPRKSSMAVEGISGVVVDVGAEPLADAAGADVVDAEHDVAAVV
jgi:hypothetical protein